MFREPESCAGPESDAALSVAVDRMIDGVEATMAVKASPCSWTGNELHEAAPALARCGHAKDNEHDELECNACFSKSLRRAREAVLGVDREIERQRLSRKMNELDVSFQTDELVLKITVDYIWEDVYDAGEERKVGRRAVANAIHIYPENEATKAIVSQIDIDDPRILEALESLGNGRD